MVEAHHGRIWAENVGRRGVAFTFTIPSPAESALLASDTHVRSFA
jgi:signal transduction histidine kinase